MDSQIASQITNELNVILRQILDDKYPYAPGYDDSSPGRFKGSSVKDATGQWRSSHFVYNEQNDSFDLYMPDYWRYIDEGRRPGAMKEVTRTSKTGKTYKVRVPEKMPPTNAIIQWFQRCDQEVRT